MDNIIKLTTMYVNEINKNWYIINNDNTITYISEL